MDEGSFGWVALLVRFAGKCKECGGPIPSGNYALWSKTLRAIKHLDCRDVRALHKNKDDKSALIEETGTAAHSLKLLHLWCTISICTGLLLSQITIDRIIP